MDVLEAVQAGDAERVRELLASDLSHARARDESGVSALLRAHYAGRGEIVALLAEARQGELDVFEAAALGHTERLTELLAADAGLVDARAGDGFTPLQLASFFGRPDAVRLLLQRGADPGATSDNDMRLQALHSAAAARQPAIARLLLDAGADADARQEGGFTALHAAAQNGDAELVRLLLARGADAEATTDDGRTATRFAAEAGHEEITRLLRG